MDRKYALLISLAVVLLLALTGVLSAQHSLRALASQSMAQGPDLRTEPRGVRPNAPTGPGFTYQG